MIRRSQELAAKRAAAAAKRAETIGRQKRLKDIAAEKEADAVKQRLLNENEYTTQFAMKRGGKIKSKRKGC